MTDLDLATQTPLTTSSIGPPKRYSQKNKPIHSPNSREYSSQSHNTPDVNGDFEPIVFAPKWRVLAKPLIWLNNQFVGHKDPSKLLVHCAVSTFAITMLSWTISNLPALLMLVYAGWHLVLAFATVPDDVQENDNIHSNNSRSSDFGLGNKAARQLHEVQSGIRFAKQSMKHAGQSLRSSRDTNRLQYYAVCGAALIVLYKLFGYISTSTMSTIAVIVWLYSVSGVDVATILEKPKKPKKKMNKKLLKK